MKRLTFRTENQWRSLRDGAGVDLIRLTLIDDCVRIGVAVSLLGFDIGLTYWRRELEWGEDIWQAQETVTVCVGDGISLRPWEPIEHDGCAGVPEQGMEKAP